MDDDMMRALGKNGGVMGVNFYAAYVNEEDADGARKLITLWVDSAHTREAGSQLV
jgi:hypothetical protein